MAKRATKPKAKGIVLSEDASDRDYFKKLREAVKKATKEDLTAPVINHRLPTGLSFLDKPLKGGLPAGRMCLIHGPEGSLKSTLLYHLGAQAQKRGGFFWLANPEDSWNDEVAALMGVSTHPDHFMYTRPFSIEEYFLTLDKFVESGAMECDGPILAGLDTLAMLAPVKEALNDITHSGLPMGVAGKIAQYLRSSKAFKRMTNKQFYLVWLQQHRDQSGGSNYGPQIGRASCRERV